MKNNELIIGAPLVHEDTKWPDKKVYGDGVCVDINPDYYKHKLSKLSDQKTGELTVHGASGMFSGPSFFSGANLRVNPPKRKRIRSCTERNYMR